MLKKILFGLLALIALLVIISFLLPKNVHVERSITIDAPASRIFPLVNDLERWEEWSPWSQRDPDMKVMWGDITVGKGASYCWEGDPNSVGKGCLTITESIENSSIKNDLDFDEQGVAYAAYTLVEEDGKTTVTWGFDTDVSSPAIIGPYIGLMMDGFVGEDYEKGLANLKGLAETAPVYSIEIEEASFGAMHYVHVRSVVSPDQLAESMGESAGLMSVYIESNNLEQAGMPFTIYNSFGEEVDFSFCIPINSEASVDDENIKYGSMEEIVCIRGVHMGSYDNLGASYGELDRYMADNGIEMVGMPIELYVTDPGEEPNPENWVTHIFYPIGS